MKSTDRAAATPPILHPVGQPHVFEIGRVDLRRQNDGGVWMVPSRGIHTFGMLFAIDLIYLDAANRVIHLVENLRPFRVSPIRIRCASVLELKIRSICSSNTQIGDELLICSPDEIRTVLQVQSKAGATPERGE